jgi:hypothetical protein
MSSAMSALVAMIAHNITWLSAIADEVVDVKLLMPELLEVSVDTSPIHFEVYLASINVFRSLNNLALDF